MEQVTLSAEEYKTLKEESRKYLALSEAGVDNWMGWDDAMQIYRENYT